MFKVDQNDMNGQGKWKHDALPTGTKTPGQDCCHVPDPTSSFLLHRLSSPVEWIHHDGPRVSHLPLYEGLAGLRSLFQPSHADGFLGPVVSPVQVVGHPVHGDALDRVDSWGRQAGDRPVCGAHSNPLRLRMINHPRLKTEFVKFPLKSQTKTNLSQE